jgi:ethanolamine ammonia-lyase small subunit
LTWEPRRGRTNAERNCISNVRIEGITYDLAVAKLHFLMNAARVKRLSGVALKEDDRQIEPPSDCFEGRR